MWQFLSRVGDEPMRSHVPGQALVE